MKITREITRDVVTDLWPLYQAGEASADSRRLVEEALREDPEFARLLLEEASSDASSRLLGPVPVPLTPDHEMTTFTRTKRALVLKDWPLFFAILFSAMAFARIVSDTSFDVSPRRFLITAGLAGVCWILFLVRLTRRLAQ